METLGLPLLKPDFDFPSVLEHPVKDRDDLHRLTVPDPYKTGPMPLYLEALHLIASSSEKPLALSITGPFTQAVLLVGAEDLARAIIRDPGFVDEVLDFTAEVVGRYAEAVVAMGARFLCVSEPTAVLLSPERFRHLVGSRLKALYDSLPQEVWRVLHICGKTDYLLQDMIACGAEGLSLDQLMDLPDIAPDIPGEVVLIGNLDPIHVLRELGSDEIRTQTIELLKAMKPYPNYLFFSVRLRE
jgi:uroporphyrinogen decarboxylase